MFTRSILPRSSIRLSTQLSQRLIPHSRSFHPTLATMVKVGDSIPSIDLYENSPGNKVSIASELSSGKGVIVGVPAAFSPGCSDNHVPTYLNSPKLKDAGKVFVVSVNDAFVMKAWAKHMDEDKKSGIRFLADPAGDFTRALDLEFDGRAFFGNKRSKRYAILTEDGKIAKVSVEEDPTQITVSGADNNL